MTATIELEWPTGNTKHEAFSWPYYFLTKDVDFYARSWPIWAPSLYKMWNYPTDFFCSPVFFLFALIRINQKQLLSAFFLSLLKTYFIIWFILNIRLWNICFTYCFASMLFSLLELHPQKHFSFKNKSINQHLSIPFL